jgi:hypothetical protein
MRSTSSTFRVEHEAKPNSFASPKRILNARAKRNLLRTLALRPHAEIGPRQNSADPER